jgi:predicted DNA repair protein MutK
LGLGWPQWLTIILLVGGLILTFKMMAKASVAYENARKAREAKAGQEKPRTEEELRKEET